MQKSRFLAGLLIPSQLLGFLALQPVAKADSWKDVEDLIELVKSSGTKVQKTGDCDGATFFRLRSIRGWNSSFHISPP